MQAVSLPVQFWHTPKGEPQGGTRFLCRTLNERERAQVFMQCELQNGDIAVSHSGLMMAVDCGVIGWENFRDANGEEVPFTPQNVGRIPAPVLIALGNVICVNSSLSDEEKKKLSVLSKSPITQRSSTVPSA